MKFLNLKNPAAHNSKIRTQIFFTLFCFSAFVLILLWLFMTVFLNYIYKNVKISEIKRLSQKLSASVLDEDLSAQVEAYAAENNLCIAVRNANHQLLSSSCVSQNCILHRLSYGEYAKYASEAKEKDDHRYIVRFERSQYGESLPYAFGRPGNVFFNTTIEDVLCTTIAEDASGRDIIIMTDAIITPIGATVTTLKTICFYITLLTLASAVFIALVLSKRMARPLIKIDNTAKLLAQGNYGVRFDESGYKEVAQLSATLNHAAHELSTVENFRRELLANVSHDLRTPLTLISGYAEVMRDLPDEITPENLQTIVDEVNRMTLLVNDLLDVSKYDAGVQKLNLESFNLTAMVATVIERFSALTEKDSFSIRFDYDEEVFITADELKLTQVMYNFLSNAIRHTGPNKQVRLAQKTFYQNKKKFVEISVTDTGEGICREKAVHIWNRYFKIDKTYKRAHSGSGLGLYIVKSILTLHGMEFGVIPLEDMPEHIGCTFWFRAEICPTPPQQLT